jgi:hypothetical protein
MKKILSIIIISILMCGCGTADKMRAKVTGNSKQCIDNVLYIQFPSGASVAYNTDGTIKVCE